MLDKISARAVVLLVLLTSGPAWGHPGHGATGGEEGWLHQLTEPVHALPIWTLIFVVAVGLGALRLARTRSRP